MKDTVEEFRACGFLPPVHRVRALSAHTERAWSCVAPLPLWVGLRGRVAKPSRARVRLAWSRDGLLRLRAEFMAAAARAPAIPPESPDFWRQEHVELRYLPDPADEARQVQIILTPRGAWWDNQGWWQGGGRKAGVTVRTLAQKPPTPNPSREGSQRSPTELPSSEGLGVGDTRTIAAGPCTELHLPLVPAGAVLRGLLSHVTWAGDVPDFACSSPVELGFSHAERFGEFAFGNADEPALSLAAVDDDGVWLRNDTSTPRHGELRVLREAPGEAAMRRYPVVLPPGLTRAACELAFSPRTLTRFGFTLGLEDGRGCALGAVTRRGPLPPLRRPALAHPFLHFDAAGLAALRAKRRQPFFRKALAGVRVTPDDLSGAGIPGPEEAVSLAITPKCMNWFRVAKETMLRDGAGDLKPSARRIWELQSPAAQEAWRGVVKSVQPTTEQLTVLTAELNRLLARRDFYDAAAFGRVALPREAREFLARGMAALSEAEVFRFNRIVLQSAVECIGNFRMDLAMKPGELLAKWLATGDDRLIATATRAVRAALRLTIFDHQIHLHEGMAASGIARAYDAFWPQLTPAERADWRALLLRLLHLYLETARRASWTVTTIANANPVGNSGCGLAALAVWDEEPEVAGEALGWVREYLWSWLDYCHGPNGGNTEGAQYWTYGMENFLKFATALERVTGSDDGFLAHPAVTQAMNMVRVGLTNDGGMSGVNDTIPMPVGGAIGWFAAGRHGDALGLWYGDHAWRWLAARRKAGKATTYGAGADELLLWRPALPEAKEPPALPELLHLPEVENTIVRSAPRFDARWVAALKGSRPPYTHHNQPDTGSLWVDLRGERLLLDPGYYKDKPECHCLPLIGGAGPVHPEQWTGRITACEARGGLRHLAVDATAAYGGRAARVVRHLVLAGEEGVVVLDDIAAAGEVTAQYQCGGPTRRVGPRAVLVRGARSALRLELFRRGAVSPGLHPERSLHDTHWGYHFADCRWFPVTASYRAAGSDPLITVVTDATRRAPAPSRVRRSPDAIAVRLPSGLTVHFARLAAGWALG
jgi:hypothetical protein